MKIGKRIYYELATGNVILDTGERSGAVIPTKVEDDFTSYSVLAARVPSSVGHIELEYGEYAQDFAECSGYRVDLDTLALEFTYAPPEPTEPSEDPVYREPLTVQVQRLQDAVDALVLDALTGGGANV